MTCNCFHDEIEEISRPEETHGPVSLRGTEEYEDEVVMIWDGYADCRESRQLKPDD
jgi:hypothetical protein